MQYNELDHFQQDEDTWLVVCILESIVKTIRVAEGTNLCLYKSIQKAFKRNRNRNKWNGYCTAPVYNNHVRRSSGAAAIQLVNKFGGYLCCTHSVNRN